MPQRRHYRLAARIAGFGWLCLFGLPGAASAQVAERDLSGFVSHTQPMTVIITVTPPPGTIAFGIEDRPPAAWANVSNIDNSGTWDSINGKVKWGPYFQDTPITLHYDITPSIPVPGGAACFHGVASIDGSNQSISGSGCLPPPVPTVSEWGLAAIALSLLIAGTLLLRQRPALTMLYRHGR